LLAGKHAPDRRLVPPPGMRERFLERLTAEALAGDGGGKLRPFPVPAKGVYSPPQAETPSNAGTEEKETRSFFSSLWRPIALAAGCLLAVAAAYYAGGHKSLGPPQVTQTVPVATPTAPLTTKAVEPDHVSALERQKTELETKLAAMKLEL